MNLSQARTRWIAGIAVVGVIVAIVIVLLLTGEDDGDDTRSFFAEATTVTCDGAPAGITVVDARFAAFSSDLTAGGSDKLALVDIIDEEARTIGALGESFTLAEPNATFTAIVALGQHRNRLGKMQTERQMNVGGGRCGGHRVRQG